MNGKIRKLVLAISLPIFVSNATGQISTEQSDDRTISPYFVVLSEDAENNQLPLKSNQAEIDIAGIIADVRITQTYHNNGHTPLEAIYIFPASTRAAVYAMRMTIGERVIEAKISRKDEARQQYEEARAQGKTASLLEQLRPNVFQMNVANILPGDEIRIDLQYTENLLSDAGVYEFVLPTVVGPRYSNQTEESAGSRDRWVKNPYLQEGSAVPYTYDIRAGISGGVPIRDLQCTTHPVDIRYSDKTRAEINLKPEGKNGGDRDFILQYRLTGAQLQPGLLLYEGEKENFFLYMMQPPKQEKPDMILPREYIFIVDVSGSMHGFPLDISKQLLRELIGSLSPADRFNVLLFAAGSHVLSKLSVAANQANITRAINLINSEGGSGGTELLPAMKRALALPKTEGYARTVIVATDGYVNVERATFDLIRHNLGEANLFAFGIGSSVNRYIIEGMARAGMGDSYVITDPANAAEVAKKFKRYISYPVFTDISVEFAGFQTYDLEPRSVPDIFSERPLVLFGKWKGNPEGKIRVKGITGGGKTITETLDVSRIKPVKSNSSLSYLWARHRLAVLSDYANLDHDQETIDAIIAIGLNYNLMTEYTSFVAIDSEVRNVGGQLTTVKQTLPLPQGVSNYALSRVAGTGGTMKKAYRAFESTADLMMAAPPTAEEEAGVSLQWQIQKLEVEPAQFKTDLHKKIANKLHQISFCLPGQMTDSLVIDLELDQSGNVVHITQTGASGLPRTVIGCVIRTMKKWQLPLTGNLKGSKIRCRLVLSVR